MDINQQAPVISCQEIFIRASLETVWHLLTDVNSWQTWNPNISHAELTGSFISGSVFRWKAGGVNITSTIQAVEPLTYLSWSGKAIGTRAIHIWTLTPQTDGLLLQTAESFEGWLVNLFKRSMAKTLEDSLKTWLEALKRKAERAE